MSARQRYSGAKGKRDGGAFIAIPLSVLNSCAYLQASAHARMLLFDLAVQYRGNNNGDLSAAWSQMHARGWRSKETLTKAKRELQELGLIVETRMGARPNKASLYAVTWHALDACGGKLEITAHSFQRGAYKLRDSLPMPGPKLQALERPAYQKGGIQERLPYQGHDALERQPNLSGVFPWFVQYACRTPIQNYHLHTVRMICGCNPRAEVTRARHHFHNGGIDRITDCGQALPCRTTGVRSTTEGVTMSFHRVALALCIACALSGCGLVAMQKFEAWNADARPRAEAGELAWSEYYKQGYDQASQLPESMPGKGLAMLQAATMIDAAKAMEAGKLSPDDFFSLQRKARAQMQMHNEQAAAQQQAMMQQWLQTQALIQQTYKPVQIAPINCITNTMGNFTNTNCR